jgi:protein gp37
MGENSAIEWTDHTMNFTEVSPACDFCYAKACHRIITKIKHKDFA